METICRRFVTGNGKRLIKFDRSGRLAVPERSGGRACPLSVGRHRRVEPADAEVDISNETTIKPVVNTANISDAIKVALGRSWFFNPKTVDVSADGGRVQLNGNVSSWHDRQIATDMAWFAPGVTAVENDLVII